MKTLFMTLVALAAASTSAGGGPLETVQAYIDAHNRHDVEAVLGLMSPAIVFVTPDGETLTGLEKMAELEAWDSILESSLEIEDLQVSGNSVVAGEIVEHNLWFDLAGIGPVSYLPGAAFEVEDGRITSIRAAAWKPDKIAEFTAFMDRFAPWALATYPQEIRAVLPGGEFRYDEARAQIWLELLVAWRDDLKTSDAP